MADAGDFSHRLQFQERAAPVDDGYGNTVAGGWTEQFTVSAAIKFLLGTETVLAARLEGRSPAVVTIRNSIGARRITHEWRAKDVRTGTIYQVREAPRQTDDRAFLEMIVEAGVAG